VIFAVVSLASLAASTVRGIETPQGSPSVTHAFAVSKQRFTLGMPEGSRKTLVDLWEPGLVLRWTTRSLLDVDALKAGVGQPNEQLRIVPRIPPHWRRAYHRIGNVPILAMEYQGVRGRLFLEALGGADADIVKIVLRSTDGEPVGIGIVLQSPNASRNEDFVLLREDKSLFCAVAGECTCQHSGAGMEITVSAGKDPHTVWIAIPHRAGVKDIAAYRARNWAEAWGRAVEAWRQVLARAVRFSIPDAKVADAYYSCLADQFILREPIRGGMGFLCGTEVYRIVNAFETDAHVQAMLRAGYFKEAWQVADVFPPKQNANGCWTDYTWWMDRFWYVNGDMPMMYEALYRFTHDKKRMAEIYPRLVRLARWCEGERAKSKSLPSADPRHGLMPPGVGDSGLGPCGGSGPDNVYFPHNTGNVTGLRITAELAREFGTKEEAAELLAAYQDARQCLLTSMERCAVAFPGGRYVPASVVPNGGGSMWLCVAFAYPGRLASYDHPLVSQTLAHFEACQSPAGIPINLGWQPRGLWPGAAMECPAPVYLRRGEIDKLSGLIYAGLNCASPVWTWPEERGADAGTQVTSGDLQEAWFPVNFCRLFRDCFLYEEDATLHLAAGIPRFWYDLGKPIGVANAPTHFGPVSYQMQYDPSKLQLTGEATFAENSTAEWSTLHIRLPGGLKVKSVNPESKATVLPDGSGLRWTAPRGTMEYQATVGT
jgi:hypothetical protein